MFSELEAEESTESDPTEKVIDTPRILRKSETDYDHSQSKQHGFDNLLIKSYTVVYISYRKFQTMNLKLGRIP